MIHAKFASSQASTVENVLFSAPLGPRSKVGGVKMYLKSAISRTFCQGYMIIGFEGGQCCCYCCCRRWLLLFQWPVVVFLGTSLVVVLFTNRGPANWYWWCSPIERPSKAELTRARWLRSSRLDPQSALHCFRSCWTCPVTLTVHSCSCSQCWTDPGLNCPHNCFHS